MRSRSGFLILAIGLALASCSDKPSSLANEQEAEQTENEQQPREDEVAEDCVAFVRATKVAARAAGTDCPTCRAEGAEVLSFREMKMERVSCAADRCQAAVSIRAVFNRDAVGTITGGLTAWIPPEQRLALENGRAPEGEQAYRVKIVYRRAAGHWRAIEFDKADPQ